MSNIKDLYGTDSRLENEGAMVEFRGGIQIRVRSENSTIVREYANRLLKKQRQLYMANNGIVPPGISDKNDIALCTNVLITGWKNVIGEDGKEVEFTPQNVERLMTDYPALRRDVMFAARTDETFREVKEAMEGNSGKS